VLDTLPREILVRPPSPIGNEDIQILAIEIRRLKRAGADFFLEYLNLLDKEDQNRIHEDQDTPKEFHP
jgi:hypothetical protein